VVFLFLFTALILWFFIISFPHKMFDSAVSGIPSERIENERQMDKLRQRVRQTIPTDSRSVSKPKPFKGSLIKDRPFGGGYIKDKTEKDFVPYPQPHFERFTDNFNKTYDAVREDQDVRYGDNKYPVMDRVARSLIAGTAGLASGLSGRDLSWGLKKRKKGKSVSDNMYERNKMPGRGRGRGRGRRGGRRGMAKKILTEVKKVEKDVKRSYGFNNNLGAIARGMSRRYARTGYRGPAKIVRAPVASGGMYAGSAIRMKAQSYQTRKGNINCSVINTRQYLGQISVTGPLGKTFWAPGASDCGGQYYFMPSNTFYWPVAASPNTFARMYQFYYLENVSFEFESSYMPGNTLPYKTYVGFVQDPNWVPATLGSSVTSTTNLTPSQILSIPRNSCAFPTWMAKKVCAPPKEWYKGVRYECRTYALNEALQFSNAAENKQACPFAMFVVVTGTIPVTTQLVYDVFVKFTIRYCEMTNLQNFDNLGNLTSEHIPSLNEKIKALELEVKKLEEEKEEKYVDDFRPISPAPSIKSTSNKSQKPK
jgi:hypothetical protein